MNQKLSCSRVNGDHELWVLDNLLSSEECTNLIDKANQIKNDSKGNLAWHLRILNGNAGRYSRVIMIDPDLADYMWDKIKVLLPEKINGFKLLYVNDHFRFSRYHKGGYFEIHKDGKNYDKSRPELSNGRQTESLLTLNIFLNSEGEYNLVGGGTSFFDEKRKNNMKLRTTVNAKAGRAALFWAHQYHKGDIVESGCKYLLRTDVMGIK